MDSDLAALARRPRRFTGPIWNPVPLVQGATTWYVLVQTSTYAGGYKAAQETSNWYEPVLT